MASVAVARTAAIPARLNMCIPPLDIPLSAPVNPGSFGWRDLNVMMRGGTNERASQLHLFCTALESHLRAIALR
jgi:hypothetical protein